MRHFDELQSQILEQILGIYNFNIAYTDTKEEVFRLVECDGAHYAWPLFCKPKKISKFKFEMICRMANDFVSGTELRDFNIQGWFTYDEFMDNFYNFNSEALSLEGYIHKNYGVEHGAQKQFAVVQGVAPQQVTQWLGKGMIVVGNNLYSFRRELNPPKSN